jgi:hypothetical protein
MLLLNWYWREETSMLGIQATQGSFSHSSLKANCTILYFQLYKTASEQNPYYTQVQLLQPFCLGSVTVDGKMRGDWKKGFILPNLWVEGQTDHCNKLCAMPWTGEMFLGKVLRLWFKCMARVKLTYQWWQLYTSFFKVCPLGLWPINCNDN